MNRNALSERAGLGALIFVGGLVVSMSMTPARAAGAYTPGWKYRTYKESIDVRKDGSTTYRFEVEYTLLAESAKQKIGEDDISYHEDSESLEDVVAYTLKQGGKRVDVPDSNIQVTSHNGINGAPPAFSDYKNRHIVFPDVEVGDTVVLSYTLKGRKPTFRNHYSLLTYYYDSYLYDDAELVVTAPKSMGLRQKTYNLDAPEITRVDHDRQRWKWTYRNATAKDPSADSQVYQRAWRYRDFPTVELSNFADYGQIAAAYEEEAGKRAVPDERVRALALEIVQGAASRREEAEKIYQWVAKNISFAGNCLTGGDVVPRTTDTVLNMKMGDCKDHSTLMQALLAARGIPSTQVLIETDSWYVLPEIPCWQAFNHAINYVPEFDVYLDATSTSSPFGVLPDVERGKPNIHTAKYRGVEQTPMRRPDQNWSSTVKDMTIREDGSIDVTAAYSFRGALANALSQRFSQWEKSPDFDSGEKYMRLSFQKSGYTGEGRYTDIAQTDGPSETFSYGMSYHIDAYVDTTNPYGLKLTDILLGPDPIASVAVYAAIDHYDHAFLCSGDTRTEQLSITFPDNVKLLAVPRSVHEQASMEAFDATYTQDGNTLHVKRTLTDSVAGPVCKPDAVAGYRKIGAAVKKDSRAQAVYEPK